MPGGGSGIISRIKQRDPINLQREAILWSPPLLSESPSQYEDPKDIEDIQYITFLLMCRAGKFHYLVIQ